MESANPSLGFGFLSYDSEDSVEQACAQRYVTVNGKQVECKRAEPRSASRRGGRTDNQWGGNGMGGPTRSWGSAPGSMLQNLGTGAPNGTLPNGYQSWGSQVQQAPYTQQSGYGAGYQNWSNSPSTGYGNTLPTYGQPNYPGYGVPSGYNFAQGTSAPATTAIASDPASSTSSTSATLNPPPQTANPYGSMGTYTQDSSSYGPAPARGGYAGSTNSQTYGSNPGYGSSTSTYGSYGDTSKSNRSQSAGQQSYHPYRR